MSGPESASEVDLFELFSRVRLEELDPPAYLAFREQLRVALAPTSVLESNLVLQFLAATDRLHRAAVEEKDHKLGDLAWIRYQSLAERAWYRAFTTLERLRRPPAERSRSTRASRDDKSKSDTKPAVGILVVPPVERELVRHTPSLPRPDETTGLPEPPPSADTPNPYASIRWRDRIGLDPAVSDNWPVILGTTVRAESVIALFGDGWALPQVSAYFPELTELDILACRACEAEQLCGPWPPNPDPP